MEIVSCMPNSMYAGSRKAEDMRCFSVCTSPQQAITTSAATAWSLLDWKPIHVVLFSSGVIFMNTRSFPDKTASLHAPEVEFSP
jgi:hypothetical protein